MRAVKSCRAMETMCRKYAKQNAENSKRWLLEANNWKRLADQEALYLEGSTSRPTALEQRASA